MHPVRLSDSLQFSIEHQVTKAQRHEERDLRLELCVRLHSEVVVSSQIIAVLVEKCESGFDSSIRRDPPRRTENTLNVGLLVV